MQGNLEIIFTRIGDTWRHAQCMVRVCNMFLQTMSYFVIEPLAGLSSDSGKWLLMIAMQLLENGLVTTKLLYGVLTLMLEYGPHKLCISHFL